MFSSSQPFIPHCHMIEQMEMNSVPHSHPISFSRALTPSPHTETNALNIAGNKAHSKDLSLKTLPKLPPSPSPFPKQTANKAVHKAEISTSRTASSRVHMAGTPATVYTTPNKLITHRMGNQRDTTVTSNCSHVKVIASTSQ